MIIDGIDASGKSTVIKGVFDDLTAKGYSCYLINKKRPEVEDPSVKEYLEKLGCLVWAEKKDAIPFQYISNIGWVYKLSLWYTVLIECYIKPKMDSYDFLLIDGWFYKLYARFCQDITLEKTLIESILKTVLIGDQVIIMKVDPKTCWKRRTSFRQTEIACFGEKIVNPYASFVTYQNKVQSELLKLSELQKWITIDCDGLTFDDTVRSVANILIGAELNVLHRLHDRCSKF